MMKRMVAIGAAFVALVALAVAAIIYAPKHGNEAEIRSLAKGGASEQELLAKVDKSSAPYKLSADELISLKKDGVPDSVLAAMIRHLRAKSTVAQQ